MAKDNPLVLVVEDDKLNYLFFQAVLDSSGYKYIRAINGLEAVNLCTENNKISIILMDIQMPVMNGITAMTHIRKLRPEIPIIATTAFAQTGDEIRLLKAGFTAYLSKPIQKDKLLRVMRKYIE